MRKILEIAALVVATLFTAPATAANTWGSDLSDLWWTPSESGWGANISHQGDIIFLTLFVYGSDGKVKWYVGPAVASQGGGSAYVFSGPLYQTTGPFLGDSFDPAGVGTRQVGMTTITFPSVSQATLSFGVDGVSVTKEIQRQTFRENNLTGNYIGAMIQFNEDFGPSLHFSEASANFTILQNGRNISIEALRNGGISCTYAGTYLQSGRMGLIAGTASCTNGENGAFQAWEIEASYQGFFTQYSAQFEGGWNEIGRFGGVKRR